jgi:AbrB family looped-hinge helix DNA binding protein
VSAAMNTTSKITSKGQLTVPYYIRNKFGFIAGDSIEFEDKGDYVIIRKPKNLMDYIGCLDDTNLPNDLEELLSPEVGKNILERK